jgi:hypothetical protein
MTNIVIFNSDSSVIGLIQCLGIRTPSITTLDMVWLTHLIIMYAAAGSAYLSVTVTAKSRLPASSRSLCLFLLQHNPY